MGRGGDIRGGGEGVDYDRTQGLSGSLMSQSSVHNGLPALVSARSTVTSTIQTTAGSQSFDSRRK